MLYWYKHTPGGIILRCLIRNATTPQNGLTGLTSASSGLIIGAIADVEATSTNYTAAASNVETITTLGTYQAPSTSKCRFKEVDSTNHPGMYEIHLATTRLSVSSATYLNVTLSGVTNMPVTSFGVRLTALDPATVMRGTDGANTTAPATPTNITDSQTAIINACATATGFGGGDGATGANTLTVTVTDADTTDPIQSARVRIYRTGEDGTTSTNASGVAVMGRDSATWNVTVAAAGYETLATTLVVSGNAAVAYELTALVVPTPSDPTLSVLTVLCIDSTGQPEPNVEIDLRIVTPPTGDTNKAYRSAKQTATSGVDGIATLEAVRGSTCEYKRGAADAWTRITIADAGTTSVQSIVGAP